MAIKYAIDKHATAFPSMVLAAEGGKHILNVLLKEDMDNGSIVSIGDYEGFHYYDYAQATGFAGTIVDQAANGNWYVHVDEPGDACLVYHVPMIEEEFTRNFQKEGNYYNASGEIVRVYELAKYDIFEVSKEAFTVPANAMVGKTVTSNAAHKIVIT